VGVGSAPSSAFLEGWRTPLPQDIAKEKCGIGPETSLEVSADLNGDGKQDRAVIAVNESRNSSGLLVNLSSAYASKWEILEEQEGTCANLGLAVSEPGIYAGYFCAATVKECMSTDKEQIKSALPGIVFFDLGRAGVTFFWNSKASAFDRLWEGD